MTFTHSTYVVLLDVEVFGEISQQVDNILLIYLQVGNADEELSLGTLETTADGSTRHKTSAF